MITLLVGPKSRARNMIERVTRTRGHEIIISDDVRDAQLQVDRLNPSLVVVVGLDAEQRSFCRHVKDNGVGGKPVLLVAIEQKTKDYLNALLEAGADDYVLGTRTYDRVDARLAFVEQKISVVDERLKVQAQLELRARQQAAVADLGRQALGGAGMDTLMHFAVRSTAELLDVDVCKVMERIDGSEDLQLRAYAGNDVSSGDGQTSRDVESLDVVSGMSVVIASERRSFGVLSVQASRQRDFSEDDVNFLRVVANVLAAALERVQTEEALRDSEAKSRAILETTVDAIITIDARGTVESFNQAAEKIFGYEAEEVVGRNIKMLMPEPYQSEHDMYIERYHETGRQNIIGIGREVTGRRKNGTLFPMDLAVSELQLEERKIFTGIIRDITDRRVLEQRVLEISDEERRRIGQDLHDGLGQMLTGIGLIGQNLARRLRDDGHLLAPDVSEVTDMVKEADQYARALARGLIPVELEANGLATALYRLSVNAQRLFSVECSFEEIGHPQVADNTAAGHLYRIAQEAVSNAVKHGKATKITIELTSDKNEIRLRVIDNGVGFPEKLSDDRGMGVNIMHYRARIIGGILDIVRGPSGGTIISCSVPQMDRDKKSAEASHEAEV